MPKNNDYVNIMVESFKPASTSGRHGEVHIRPAAGQLFPQTMVVECSRTLKNDYPVGTKFRINVKLTDKEGGTPFLYSYFGWSFEVLKGE